jgi:hypothetical protein
MSCHQTALATSIAALVLLVSSISWLVTDGVNALRADAAKAALPDRWDQETIHPSDEKEQPSGGVT